MKLKRSLSGQIKQVLAFLKQYKNPIAQTTVRLIESKEVVVDFFKTLSSVELKKVFKQLLPNKRVKSKPGIERRLLKKINNDFMGSYTFPNKIRISHKHADVPALADTLIHECNHYLNEGSPIDSVKFEFEQEYVAFLAAYMGLDGKLTRGKCQQIRNEVTKRYPEVKQPKAIDTNELLNKAIMYRLAG